MRSDSRFLSPVLYLTDAYYPHRSVVAFIFATYKRQVWVGLCGSDQHSVVVLSSGLWHRRLVLALFTLSKTEWLI